MMLHFPYLGMPYYNRYSRYGYRYPYYTYPNYNYSTNNYDNYKKPKSYCKEDLGCKAYSSNINTSNKNSSYNDCKNNNKKSENKENNSKQNCDSESQSPMFNLLGIDLYFDDILIICLIWFLYSEGVKDEELFISLILLLLS